MGHGPELPYIREVVVFLIATVLVIPLFHRLKISPILGYLLVGGVVGPYGFALSNDVEDVQNLAELGVIFLLFIIGLELSLRRLWTMRKLVFGMGTLQVVITAIVIGFVTKQWGNTTEASIVLGSCLALSSTAMVIQLLIDGGEFSSKFGRSSFALLLFQDLAVVPILLLTNFFGDSTSDSIVIGLSLALLKAFIAIAVIFIAGRLMLRPLFKNVAGTESPDLFMAMSLLAILGTALLTGITGLSMSLGAFLAGLLLSETEFRHQIETDIKPFKGILLGLFFVSVGMGINFSEAITQYKLILLSVAGLFLIKGFIIAVLAMIFGISKDVAVRMGLLLGQAGEFGFVVIGIAKTSGVINNEVALFMLIVVSISMVATPFVSIFGKFIGKYFIKTGPKQSLAIEQEDVEDLADHVIVAGFGRVGKTIAALLDVEKATYVALDLSVRRLAEARKTGQPVYYGDASRLEILEKFRVGRASAVVVTFDNPVSVKHTVKLLRDNWSSLPIYVRSNDIKDCEELYKLGATMVVPETVESSLQLAGKVLNALGTPMEAVNQEIEMIRDSDYIRLRPK